MTDYCTHRTHRRRAVSGGVIIVAGVMIAAAAHADRLAVPCTVTGTQVPSRNTPIYSAASGGSIIAELTGTPANLELRDVPADAKSQRAKIAVIDGGLRIEGYVALDKISVYAARDIAIHAGQVAIATGNQVVPSPAGAGSLTATMDIVGAPRGTKVSASAPCAALTLNRVKGQPLDVPRRARAYSMKRSSIDLYDRPGGKVIYTLQLIDGSSQVFWSVERGERGYRRVLSRNDLDINAWVKGGDIKALSRKETEELLVRPAEDATTTYAELSVALNPVPATMKAPRDLVIRGKKDSAAPSIGLLASGAEVYVMESTLDGWKKVLPKLLSTRPVTGVDFWVSTQ